MTNAVLRLSPIDTKVAAPLRVVDGQARSAQGDLAFEVVQDMTSLEALEDAWRGLFAAHGDPAQVFQSYRWCWHWCRHYLARGNDKGPKLAIVIGRAAGEVVLIWPMVTERQAGLNVLSFLGDPVSQYGDILAAPIARNQASMLQAWQLVISVTRADVANLRKVRGSSFAAQALSWIGARIVAEDMAPYIDFSKSTLTAAGEPQHATKRRAKNRRRQLRRLEERGTLEFVAIEPGPEATEMVDLAIKLKRDWLARKNEISRAFGDDRFLAFFRDVVSDTGHDAPCRVSILRSNGEVAAIQVTPTCRDHHFLHISVYEPSLEKFATGGLLLENRVDDAYLSGARVYDLLPPHYAYKMEFADSVERVCDHAVAITVAGRLHAALFLDLRKRLKTALTAMPSPVRKAAAALHRRLGARHTAPASND